MTTEDEARATGDARSAPADRPKTMRAIVQDRYGTPEVLEVRQMPVHEPRPDQVLIEIVAASLNAYDWHMTTGTPYMARAMAGLTRPKRPIPGADVSGVVVAVGDDVSGFQPGDEVFGEIGFGAFAEFAVASPRALAHKPAGVGFEDA
ncbi:MAG: alcohol dehydrogenase catalytic domain-containing protein, partial [Acidimicrobiia bacterium]